MKYLSNSAEKLVDAEHPLCPLEWISRATRAAQDIAARNDAIERRQAERLASLRQVPRLRGRR